MPTNDLRFLVSMMTSPQTLMFNTGLTEAKSLVQAGDDTGLKAVKTAIIRLSGRKDFEGYKPGPTARSDNEYTEAEGKLVTLARNEALLDDPYETQNLISAFKQISDQRAFSRLVDRVVDVGGESQGRAFLLLNMDMWCWVQLRRTG